MSKKTATRSRASEGVFGYAISLDRVAELAEMDLPPDATIAVISKEPVAALQAEAIDDVKQHGDFVTMHLADQGGGAAGSAFEPDARARAILRGLEVAQADLVEAGGAYTLSQVQKLMRNVSRQRIEQRVKERSLLAIPGPSNRRYYPTLQFNPDGSAVGGLREVQEALGFKSPWAVLNFLINPDDRLNNERPIDVLRRGQIDRVVESARRIGEQGA